MSYILDALRRADAERQHGQVPGLNTQASVPRAAPPPLRRSSLVWALLALVLVAAAGGAWWWAGTRAVGVALSSLPATPLPGSALASAPASAQATAQASAPMAPSVQAPVPVPVPVQAPTLPVVVSAAPAAPVAPVPEPAPASAAAAKAPPEPPPVPVASLSPEQRRDMPPLDVSGAVWSASPASRFVMLNGQLTREGDTVAPGLVLERITPKSAVLRWRDLRVELPL